MPVFHRFLMLVEQLIQLSDLQRSEIAIGAHDLISSGWWFILHDPVDGAYIDPPPNILRRSLELFALQRRKIDRQPMEGGTPR